MIHIESIAMTPRTVKTKVIRMAKRLGGMKNLCLRLDIELSMGYKLKGSSNKKPIVPGKYLYPVICDLYKELFPRG